VVDVEEALGEAAKLAASLISQLGLEWVEGAVGAGNRLTNSSQIKSCSLRQILRERVRYSGGKAVAEIPVPDRGSDPRRSRNLLQLRADRGGRREPERRERVCVRNRDQLLHLADIGIGRDCASSRVPRERELLDVRRVQDPRRLICSRSCSDQCGSVQSECGIRREIRADDVLDPRSRVGARS